MKTVDGAIVDRIEVASDTCKITLEGTDYYLLLDVVGIGYHQSARRQDKYKMVCYNNNVLSGSDIDLSE